jgi:hypothetical protein
MIHSASAQIAEVFVRRSSYGMENDPQLSVTAIAEATGSNAGTVRTVLEDLERRGLVVAPRRLFAPTDDESAMFGATPALFAAFDARFLGNDPRNDAEVIEQAVPAGRGESLNVVEFIREHGWSHRRVNPAIALLLAAGRVKAASVYVGDGLIWKSLFRPGRF